jgi:hypothetical protein
MSRFTSRDVPHCLFLTEINQKSGTFGVNTGFFEVDLGKILPDLDFFEADLGKK